MPGQGQDGQAWRGFRVLNIESCKSKCIEFDWCLAVDFTSKDKWDACRLYAENNARSDPGSDNRQYCIVKKGTGKIII